MNLAALLGERIRRFISNPILDLKQQIEFLSLVINFSPYSSSTQLGLSQYGLTVGEDLDDGTNDKNPKALIYIRVSSSQQAAHGSSLDEQKEKLTQIAEKSGFDLAHEPIQDDGKTGKNFDRKGIQKIFRLAQRDDIDYLLCQDVSRIGRSAAETLYFIYILQTECNVTLVTTSGEQDIQTMKGLMHTTLMSLMSEVVNDIRTSKAKDSKKRNFLEDKNWNSIYPGAPAGYKINEDGWLELIHSNEEAVRCLFDTFIECETYSRTEEKVKEEFDGFLQGHRVKTLLTNPVYIGKPQLPKGWMDSGNDTVEDLDLSIISEEKFQQVQEIVEKKDEKHTTSDDSMSIVDFISEFDLFSVVQGSPAAKLACECGGCMNKDGQRNLKGDLEIHKYKCVECGKSRRWPKESEYDRIELIYKIENDSWDLSDLLKK